MYREVHAKERLEEELKEKSLNLERKESEVINLRHQLRQTQLNIGKLETSTKDLKVLNGRKQ
jgi:DNA-directed RNA polymerase specialized sigma subunit